MTQNLKPTQHRWRMRSLVAESGKALIFRCPCGFSVAQKPTTETFPHSFINAVNAHLRLVAIEDGNVAENHIVLMRKSGE